MRNPAQNAPASRPLSTRAIVFEKPEALALRTLELTPPGHGEVLVDVEWSAISTGTERLLWNGQMPPFPGLGYPLVPGYETVGRVAAGGRDSRFAAGDRVFVSGASCYGDVRGLFGGAASRLVADGSKLVPVGDGIGEEGTLLALAATALHALRGAEDPELPDLIIGHGVLGRLLARLTIALGGTAPRVWETDSCRCGGASNYDVLEPGEDDRQDYARIVDASGDSNILDAAIPRLARAGEIVLAGFYARSLSFAFPPAFIREASMRVSAEWTAADLRGVKTLVDRGTLSLTGLITHRAPARDARRAYPTAFGDPDCLKMVIDWRNP